jgi:hypothetical protein
MTEKRWSFEDLEGAERAAALSRMTREEKWAAWEALNGGERLELVCLNIGGLCIWAGIMIACALVLWYAAQALLGGCGR